MPLKRAAIGEETVTLSAKVNVGTDANPRYEKREAHIAVAKKANDLEGVLETIKDFEDATAAKMLNYDTGSKRFINFIRRTFEDHLGRCEDWFASDLGWVPTRTECVYLMLLSTNCNTG